MLQDQIWSHMCQGQSLTWSFGSCKQGIRIVHHRDHKVGRKAKVHVSENEGHGLSVQQVDDLCFIVLRWCRGSHGRGRIFQGVIRILIPIIIIVVIIVRWVRIRGIMVRGRFSPKTGCAPGLSGNAGCHRSHSCLCSGHILGFGSASAAGSTGLIN